MMRKLHTFLRWYLLLLGYAMIGVNTYAALLNPAGYTHVAWLVGILAITYFYVSEDTPNDNER